MPTRQKTVRLVVEVATDLGEPEAKEKLEDILARSKTFSHGRVAALRLYMQNKFRAAGSPAREVLKDKLREVTPPENLPKFTA